jgi:ABC-2 type transport system ATP-binding protein
MTLAEKLSDRILIIHEGLTLICDTTASILQEVDFHEDLVQVRVAGRLSDELSRRLVDTFPALRLSDDDAQAVLTWPAPAQAELLALLQTLDEHEVQIVDVGRRQPTLEEVFLHLTGGGKE